LRSFGASASYSILLSEETSFSPNASISFDRTDVSRVAVLPVRGLVVVEARETGTTWSQDRSVSRTFDKDQAHRLVISSGYAHGSNAAAGGGSISGARGSRALRRRGDSGADSWFDLGADATFTLTERMDFLLDASRTFGMGGPDR